MNIVIERIKNMETATAEVRKYPIKIVIEYTEQQLADLIDQGLRGASTYWLGEVEQDDPTLTAKTIGEGIAFAKWPTKIYDVEEEKWHRLSLGKIQKGLAGYMKEYQKLDIEEYDMYDAERVIQYAIFGKVVYG